MAGARNENTTKKQCKRVRKCSAIDCRDKDSGSCHETPRDAASRMVVCLSFYLAKPSPHACRAYCFGFRHMFMHWHARDSAAELARRSVTYQKKPKTSADTGDGPCDEEEEDAPEDSEDGIAGRHGDYLVVDLLILLTCDGCNAGLGGRFYRRFERGSPKTCDRPAGLRVSVRNISLCDFDKQAKQHLTSFLVQMLHPHCQSVTCRLCVATTGTFKASMKKLYFYS